jgi:hypothetical protein
MKGAMGSMWRHEPQAVVAVAAVAVTSSSLVTWTMTATEARPSPSWVLSENEIEER